MKIILPVFVLVIIGASLVSAKEKTMQDLIRDSCGLLENCEIEGNILNMQGMPFHLILYGMCKIRLTVEERVGCYMQGYYSFPKLGRRQLMQGYKNKYSISAVKSYLFFVRRTCIQISCGLVFENCGVQELKCWQTLTQNLNLELPFIIGKTVE